MRKNLSISSTKLNSTIVEDYKRGFTFINLNYYLYESFKEYTLYISDNELLLSRVEKNRLGLHFIISRLLDICSDTSDKKWFYYKTSDSIESKLVKRLFNTLPSNITYGVYSFGEFLDDRNYIAFNEKDISCVNFRNFFNLLRRNGLRELESKFKCNINIKRSLLP